MLILEENQLESYGSKNRYWQGIPGVERTKNGRLFVTFYSGGITEQLGNYCVLIKSDDDGQSWSEPIAATYKGENFRCYDPCLWMDPLNKLWFIWSVMPEHSVWAVQCDNPDGDKLNWSKPRIIGNDVMMNKPVVLSSGEWLFPIAIWNSGVSVVKDIKTTDNCKYPFVYKSENNGKSFVRLGGADVPGRSYDEHMVLELNNGVLMMLVRTFYGIGNSYSYDKGLTWTAGEDSGLGGPNSRFHIKRLSSGNVLLINHYNYTGRNNLTAMISCDDCKTWEGFLLLDERSDISYPDAVEADNGYLYVVYDHERGAVYNNSTDYSTNAREILIAKFTEEDILAGKILNKNSRLKMVVNKLSVK